jgi:hypothetical protein
MRLMLTAVALVVLVASCKDQAPKPAGLDPIVLVNNNQSAFPASMTWYSQSGQVLATTFPANTSTCIDFTSSTVTDSVRFVVVLGDTTGHNGPWAKGWSPWFDPRTGLPTAAPEAYPDGAEYWTLDITGGPSLVMKAVAEPPCTP